MEILIYPICGVFAGLIAGLFGVGGGLIVVPVLASVFAWQSLAPAHTMQLALGTSLVTIVATSLASTWSHQRYGGVHWAIFRRLAPGIVVGSWLGAGLADRLDSDDLRLGFGLAECLLGVYMWFKKPGLVQAEPASPHVAALLGGGVGIGAVSSLAGIGGGTLTVPYLLRSGLAMTRAVGTSAACGVPIAVFGSLSYLYFGWDQAGLPEQAWGYLYWPAALGIMLMSAVCAPLGAAWAQRLPPTALKRGFALLLVLMGVKMLFF